MLLSVPVQIATALAFTAGLMTILWLVQRRTGNASIVDVGWAGGIGVQAVFYAITSGGPLPRRVLVGAMAGIWSLRLTTYLWTRVVGRPEEGRYVTLRNKWAPNANSRFFLFFQFQALAAALFALPVLVVAQRGGPALDLWDWFGASLWAIGLVGTALADWQLARFKQQPDSRGRTCRQGLWNYSRHPNYFFEWIHWCSYTIMSIGSAYWWVALMVPTVLLFVLFKVTGIPPTEAQALASRSDYRDYQQTTSVFVPWLPKKRVER